MGIQVPEELSLASFGDMGISDQVWPGITAVKYPIAEIVEESVEMLVKLVEGEKPESNQAIFPTEIILRGSTTFRKS